MKIAKETVTSRKNPLVLLAASLTEKKYRDEHRLFAASGRKLCAEAVSAGVEVTHILVSEAYDAVHREELLSMFSDSRYEETVLAVLTESCFEKITTEKAAEGIILLIKYLDISKKYNKIIDVAFLAESDHVLFLESIRDPGNLGTVLRSAGAFGVTCVFLSGDCVDLYNPRTVRAAMGALFRVATVRVESTAEAIASLRTAGRRVLAAELRPGAIPIDEVGLCWRDVIMIGNEGHGIPEAVSALCDASIYIPIAPQAESLNAAAAATVLLWEQQNSKK